MPTGNISFQASLAGISVQSRISRQADGVGGQQVSLAAGKTGTLTTRTDANTGTLTMSAGHGITTGANVDIYWDGGVQYNVTVGTVSGNSVPFDSGVGDDLPSTTTAVIVSVRQEVDLTFDGDQLEMIVAQSTKRGHMDFYDDSASVLAASLAAGEPWNWTSDGAATNPLAGEVVEKVYISNGEAAAATFTLGVLYDSTP